VAGVSGAEATQAFAIRESGAQLVGWNRATADALRWNWTGSTWTVDDLQDLVPSGALPELDLFDARDISNTGWIVGTVDVATSGVVRHALLLTPQSSCPEDVANDDDEVDVSDLLAVLGAWGPCTPGAFCTADVDGDFTVGVADLLAILASWGPCGDPESPPQSVQDCIDKIGYEYPEALEACIQALPD
jgi:hypothetical protein